MTRRHPFNLIEITIALGVIAIGIVAVVGVFPMAANNCRDAIAERYSAQAATDLLTMIGNQARTDWSGWVSGAAPYLSDTAPVAADRDDFTLPGSCVTLPSGNETLWAYSSSGTYVAGNRRFKIIRYVDDRVASGGTANEYDPANDLVDFQAIMVVWRSQVVYNGTTTLPYDYAVRLNAEISWPAQMPYDKRAKAYYTTELFRR